MNDERRHFLNFEEIKSSQKLYSLLLLFTAFAIQAPAKYWQMQNIGYTYAAAFPDDIEIVDSDVVWTLTSRVGDVSGIGVQFWSRTIDGHRSPT